MSEWINVEDYKPPFGEPVLGWNTCESCRDNKDHTHNLLARSYPIHGPLIVKFHPPDMALVNHYRNKGDHSWDHYSEPYWSPIKPSHWKFIESPYDGDKKREPEGFFEGIPDDCNA